MKENNFKKMKSEIQLEAKNGLDFILAAGIVWSGISSIWTLHYPSYEKSIFTFIVGAVLLPLAFGFSKILGTNWKVKNNPLQPLGLWLNFAQLIYFPFLIFVLIKDPDYFIMAYAIITGAHLFPYAWFYDEMGYAVAAILISVSALLIAFQVNTENIFYIPLFTAIAFLMLGAWIWLNYNKRKKQLITESN